MTFQNNTFLIKYSANGSKFECKGTFCKHFSLAALDSENGLKVILKPTSPVIIEKCELILPYSYTSTDKIFANGFQSWTDSKEYSPSQKMDNLKKICLDFANNFPSIGLNCSGDYQFHKYSSKRGVFYGYSYGYIKRGLNIDLFGSLSERNGYTVFTFDTNKQNIIIQKELENVVISEEYVLFDLVQISDNYDSAFDKYFELMNVVCSYKVKKSGYTTWYNYYKHINESIVAHDLDAISKLESKIDIFQIDDGYQHAIGDWLTTDIAKFPNGMKAVADQIHDKKMLAGLWLAPFAVCANSDIYAQHRDWLICDKKGKPRVAGPNWGSFYCLDISKEEVRTHIRNVFDTVLNKWGYDMVKLDFLYAAGEFAIHNKSRGQLMCEAMDFIRECVGSKLLLGCGVPLMPAFGKVDFCRIGADLSLSWRRKPYALREDVSTPNTLECTIFRRHLNGRAFQNDPDVFLLRDDNIKMNLNQRKLATKINQICGSLLFTSDNVGNYSDEQVRIFNETISKSDIKVIDAEFIGTSEIVSLKYNENNVAKELKFNMNNGAIVK